MLQTRTDNPESPRFRVVNDPANEDRVAPQLRGARLTDAEGREISEIRAGTGAFLELDVVEGLSGIEGIAQCKPLMDRSEEEQFFGQESRSFRVTGRTWRHEGGNTYSIAARIDPYIPVGVYALYRLEIQDRAGNAGLSPGSCGDDRPTARIRVVR